MSQPAYTIKSVAKRTGLSTHVIRIWEKRYGAVRPLRTGTNRRLYSEEEAKRLELLRRARQAGHSIGAIATLENSQLLKLAQEFEPITPANTQPGPDPAEQYIMALIQHIQTLDSGGFQKVLSRAIVALGQHGLLERVIGPLARRIGELWRQGTIMAAHEHFASAVIRDFLARNSRPFATNTDMPTLVVATPPGQLHELGAVMVAAAANDIGWRVIYLGTSLPVAEIAAAAVHNRARAVALSIVYPEDDSNLPLELENLRAYMPAGTKLIVGGRAAHAYRDALAKTGAVTTEDFGEIYDILDGLRAGRS